MPVEARGIEIAGDWHNVRSGETYVGLARAQGFASPGLAAIDEPREYTVPARLHLNEWALAGDWTLGREEAVSNAANGRIAYRFHARDLHLILTPPTGRTSARFRVRLDGQAPGDAHGIDIDEDGNGVVAEAAALPTHSTARGHHGPALRDRAPRSGRRRVVLHVWLDEWSGANRVGAHRHRCDGASRSGRSGRHPHQLARDGAGRRRPPGELRGGTRRDRRARRIPRDRLRLLPGAGDAAADDRLRPARLTARTGRVDARPRHRQLPEDLPRLCGRAAFGQSHPGPHPRQHHGVLADGHRGVGGAGVLGESTRASARGGPNAAGSLDPRGVQHVPGRDLPGATQLGRAGLPEARLLQRSRAGRPLRRMGRAATLLRGTPRNAFRSLR